MYWNEAKECISRDDLKKLQLKRLKEVVARVYHNVPFYRRAFQERGILPEDIKSLEDLTKLPFTIKKDLRDNYPYGLFAVPLSEIVRIHASSGTTGKPTTVGYTRNDITMWSELMGRSMTCAGIDNTSIVQVSYGYGLFTGGLGAHYGAERIGASVIPMSGGNTQKQIMLMKDFRATALACTPSYAIHLADALPEAGVTKEELSLKSGVFGAEPWSEEMRHQLENKLGIKAYDVYGLSEIMGPGVAMECECQNGLHIWEDHFIAEILDPATLEPVPYGQKGELVITTITKEGLPLIRYRTKDITALHIEKCECGRTHARMDKITGRTDDMLIIRGVNVFPSQIESVLLEVGEVEPHYQLIVTRDGNLDNLEIMVELSESAFSDKISELESIERRIKSRIASVLGISARIKFVEPKTIPRSEGKAIRVFDKRKI